MNDVLLPWTTCGVRYKCRDYLSSTLYTEASPVINADDRLRADLPLAKALPMLKEEKMRAVFDGPPAEYGCFSIDGKLLEPVMRGRRQVKNCLYYMASS